MSKCYYNNINVKQKRNIKYNICNQLCYEHCAIGGSTTCRSEPGRLERLEYSGDRDTARLLDPGRGASGTDPFVFVGDPEKSVMRSSASAGRAKFSGYPSDPDPSPSCSCPTSCASEMFDSVEGDTERKSLESGELGGRASGLANGAE